MDWARAIAINQSALTRIVAALIAMAGIVDGVLAARLSRPTYNAVLRVLRPAEAAVRRLIVIAARGIVVKPSPNRPLPKGLKIAGKTKGQGRIAFQLCDPRQRFRPWWTTYRPKHKRREPHIWFFGKDPNLSPLFQPESGPRRAPPKTDNTVDASRLGRRLLAIKQALENLPAQAKRLVRWRMRREAKAKFTSALRPGRPPGHRKKETHDVDRVLKECHALAREVERDDTS